MAGRFDGTPPLGRGAGTGVTSGAATVALVVGLTADSDFWFRLEEAEVNEGAIG